MPKFPGHKRKRGKNPEKLADLKIKPIPIPPGHVHPDVPYKELPQHEFTLGLIAPKGGGKTTTACNLIGRFYKGYFHKIYVISPTILSDEKWDWLKEQDILAYNKPLADWVHDMLEHHEPDKLVPNAPTGELSGLASSLDGFSARMKDEDFIEVGENLDDAEEFIRDIAEQQKAMIEMLKKYGQPKHLAHRIMVVCDDLVGSRLFKRTGYFAGLNTRHRHYGMSMLMMTQAYKEIPKTIRTNWTAALIYEIGNMKELEMIYEEYQMGLDLDTWMRAYDYCMEDDDEGHNFMYLNMKKPKRLRVMKNFEEYIIFKKENTKKKAEEPEIEADASDPEPPKKRRRVKK